MDYINAAAIGIVIYMACCIMLAFYRKEEQTKKSTLSDCFADTVGMFNFAVLGMAIYHVWRMF